MYSAAEIWENIEALKKHGHVQSNLYSNAHVILDHLDEAVVTDKTILTTFLDHGVRRLYYYTLDFSDIIAAAEKLSSGVCVLEFMTRDPSEYRSFLQPAGFSLLAGMMRMSVYDCAAAFQNPEISGFYDASIGYFPDETEAAEINRVLWQVFDTRISHLCTEEETADAIRKREITIRRDENGTIKAVLQAVVNPKKFYINQVYNGTEKRIIHAMLLNRLKSYIDAGGKYAYAWVAEDNNASIKFHKKYGFLPDGMWNMVYQLKG